MQFFYSADIQSNTIFLDEEESAHCSRTLRKKLGDLIEVMDGRGGWYKAQIISIHKNSVQAQIVQTLPAPAARQAKLHLAIAPTKNIDRIEFLLEKGVEIGLETFSLLLCEHSERKNVRVDRLEKIALAACKQSFKSFLPIMNNLQNFEKFITQYADNQANKYIAYCGEAEKNYLPLLLETQKVSPQSEETLILIGPEGDFSPKEVELAQKSGFQPISLGESRLRTETAGLAAVLMFGVDYERKFVQK